MNRISQASALLLALHLPFATSECLAGTAVVDVPLNTPAMQVSAAQNGVLIGLARAGTRLVAVGERGLVLLSDDNGQSWRQASVPVSVSLTAVQFVDAQQGWAVGHAGVVLTTHDGGEHWTLQLDGVRVARLELDTAKAEQATAANPDDALARVQNAERLVADGADKPFLALQFIDAHRGVVVGAYGLAPADHRWRCDLAVIDGAHRQPERLALVRHQCSGTALVPGGRAGLPGALGRRRDVVQPVG